MATFVLKIKYEETLRRMTVPSQGNGSPPSPAMSFSELEESVRDMFKLPSSSEIALKYTDDENDVITLTGDEDLHDACVVQGLNPLRLHVTLAPPPATAGLSEFLKAWSFRGPAGFADAGAQGLAPAAFGNWGRRFWSFPDVQLEPLVRSSPSSSSSAADEASTSQGNAGNATASAAAVASDEAEDVDRVRHFGVQCDACNVFPIVGPRFKSKKKFDFDLCQACFQKTKKIARADDDEYTRIDRPLFPPHQFFPSSSDRRGAAGCPAMMNPGSRCPAMVNPGSRSPAMMNPGSRCPAMANPGSRCPVMSMGPSGCLVRNPSGCPVRNPSCCSKRRRPFVFMRGAESSRHGGGGGCGSSCAGGIKPAVCGEFACNSGSKLDARFAQDVTIFDGTELAPGTPFTKIWRLRNSDSLPLPKETRLLRVGGDDELRGSVQDETTALELPEQGLAPEAEVEASADLVAPMQPGRYVSYWRLLAPFSREEFGHRLWVLIQVAPKDEESPQVAESLVQAHENAPQDRKQSAETKQQSVEAAAAASEELAASAAIEPDAVVVVQAEDPEAAKAQEEEEEAGAVEASELGSFSVVEVPATEDTAAMVAALEGMGFKDKDWNLEVLETNKNDMQATLDALVAVAEWDPKLEDLDEMGFYDKQLNRTLMLKNKGSLKHVVKELVQMYKPPAAAAKPKTV